MGVNPWGLVLLALGLLCLVLAIRDTGGTLLDGLGWTHGSYASPSTSSSSGGSSGTTPPPAAGPPVTSLPDSPNLN